MSDRIKLEIFDRKTGERRIEETSLPAEIGKSPGGPNRIVLAADRPTISRSHGRFERRGDELRFVDTSSNGTTVGAERIKGIECRIRPEDEITIEDYAIRVVVEQTIALKLTDMKLTQLADKRVAAGGACIVTRDVGAFALQRPDELDDSAGSTVLELSFDGAAVSIDPKAGADVPEIRINNRTVSLPARASPGDVILVGDNRIEVLRSGQEKIVCGNTSCHLMNDLPFEENCVWCGYYLAASGSFTRVTPP